MESLKVSYCIGVYNEEKILLKNVGVLETNLEKILGRDNYEIVLVENGSTDKTRQILSELKDKNLKILYLKKKGHGASLKMALTKASYNYCLLTAIDIPFGFDDLKQMVQLKDGYDLIFGSKAHPDSKIIVDLKRRIASYVFRLLIRLFFHLQIRDPQGSIFVNRRSIESVLNHANANNSFFTTQLAIYSKLFGLRLTEIPVTLNKDIRKSKYNIFRDGTDLFLTLLKEYKKYREVRKIANSQGTS
ncbi:MAG: hypothetical protein A3F33_00770 [Candidatus Woykebacteria bacterium RIFCSPHIGHO2_12_FULL_43_10]|uniref:Glycosyltransferase 2-like domain-containing protein n=2 Tax=Candidatus Woykeibacteriota TaxID=1817899 RepID=A0A1G1WYQ3_9BACT|nr:MAG: hypothetical protein A3F33_00770 [Candidatus Woykebacteria bacterium RIFCSPHIGHO2_12_FULL_43_10]OGY29106.1 MAG: hypothetical protein A3J50_02365 [Candidatus Woykebacteria bacterium RIFCSPHIGHO2_02_FULL_43_16b]OGY32886.1 MAG: hypothetical protein A3A61_02610 [Candidatus Woykebacteria bacterium RIFCSPLOWO2_01_FULL_43_14]